MLEKQIEKALVAAVKNRGGIALKFVSPGMSGVPDRLLLLPKTKLAFVELKVLGKPLRPLQIKRKKQLEAFGFLVYCLDNVQEIERVLDEICTT
jgi:hypothetical protein